MKIELTISCDCEIEFTVKLPDGYCEPNNKNAFVLNCPYCGDPVNHYFHIQEINQKEYDGELL